MLRSIILLQTPCSDALLYILWLLTLPTLNRYLRSQKPYKPPGDAGQKVLGICERVLGTQAPNATFPSAQDKWKVLTQCSQALGHTLPNSLLHRVTSVGEWHPYRKNSFVISSFYSSLLSPLSSRVFFPSLIIFCFLCLLISFPLSHLSFLLPLHHSVFLSNISRMVKYKYTEISALTILR